MKVFRNERIEEDGWISLSDTDPVPADGAVLVGLARWLRDRDSLVGRNAPVGVRIDPADAVEDLVPDMSRISLVAVHFPRFADGRGYSSARLLRERYGYDGEIRATGDVLIDQIPFMRRCGIDSFEASHPDTVAALVAGSAIALSVHYQPAATAEPGTSALRPWRRRKVC